MALALFETQIHPANVDAVQTDWGREIPVAGEVGRN
jgi:hypothetical protein